MPVMEIREVSYTYQSKYQQVQAVRNATCDFEEGMVYAIIGRSGSGKTTLLSLMAGLDTPTTGKIFVCGEDLSDINRDIYRRETASVIYQAFHLFPLLTALENVMYPMELRGKTKGEARREAARLLSEVDLPERIGKQFPQMLSGGEQQRVAIARALAAGGRILLADEPTGNLDTASSELIIGLLKRLAKEKGYTVIIITHDMGVAGQADIVYRMSDGVLSLEQQS